MPIAINNLVVHKLIKNQHGPATIDLAPNLIEVNATAERLLQHLHELYSERTGKGFGQFEEDEVQYPMQVFINDAFVIGEIDFYTLTDKMMRHLQDRAGHEPLATGGYVLIAEVVNGSNLYLLVAIVTEVVGTAITEGLEIIESVHLDMNNLRVAGRVDITSWQNGAERYLSFLKGRGDLANYFKQFLGCNDVQIARDETKKLVAVLDRFANDNVLNTEQRDLLFNDAHDYLRGLAEQRENVNLEAFSNRIWPADPRLLMVALSNEAVQISDGFIPDKSAIKKLVKFKASSQNWKLEFDRSGLRNGSVVYDPETEKLILSNIPAALRQELQEELGDEPG